MQTPTRLLFTFAACCALPALAADWKDVQRRPASVIAVDMEGVVTTTAVKDVRVRETFNKPTTLSSGQEADTGIMSVRISCADRSATILKEDFYSRGKVVYTVMVKPENIQSFPIGGNQMFSESVCGPDKQADSQAAPK